MDSTPSTSTSGLILEPISRCHGSAVPIVMVFEFHKMHDEGEWQVTLGVFNRWPDQWQVLVERRDAEDESVASGGCVGIGSDRDDGEAIYEAVLRTVLLCTTGDVGPVGWAEVADDGELLDRALRATPSTWFVRRRRRRPSTTRRPERRRAAPSSRSKPQ